MVHLLWGILNFIILFYFLLTVFKALRLVREKMGLLPVLVIVFGLMSFVNSHVQDEETTIRHRNDEVRAFKTLKLEDDWVTSYLMDIRYQKDHDEIIPVKLDAQATGFVFGTNIKTGVFTINRRGDKFEYEIIITVKWNLMGSEVYSESKSYKGLLP